MIRLARLPSILIISLSLALVAGLLLIPIPSARHHRFLTAVLNFGHVPLFAILAWIIFRVLGRSWTTLGTLMMLVVVGEWIQVWAPGRTPDWSDAEHGLVGVAIAWLAEWREKRTLVRWALGGILLLLPMARLGPELADVVVGWREFPVLASFERSVQIERWKLHGASLRRVVLADGTAAGELRLNDQDEFPGAELVPVVADWRGWKTLCLEFEIDQPTTLMVTIRDQRPANGYTERFNVEKKFEAGRHRWSWSLNEIEKAPGGKDLNLSKIDSINLFVDRSQRGTKINIVRVELRD
jgi:hypothetical protein